MESPMHTHYMGLAGSALRTAIALTAGLCFLAFGYGQGDIGGLMILESFVTRFPNFNPKVYQTENINTVAGVDGTIVACWNLGCFVGAFLTIFLGDRLGRKGSITVGLVLETIGKIIQASSFGIGQYIAGRVIAGVGNGFIASTIPAWQAECLKTHRRGTMLLVSFGTCITLGVAVSYWFVYAFSWAEPSSVSWRAPVVLSLLFILPALCMIVFMPESPRWLLLQAREQEAICVLSALNELPEDSEDIRREVLQIKNTVKYMASTPSNGIFSNNEFRCLQRTLLAVLLQVMQQFTGVNLFIQYLGVMFVQQLHFAPGRGLLLAAACSTEFFLASLAAVVLIDRFWGRRTLTMFGASGMCVCLIVLSICNYIGVHDQTMKGFYVMAAFLFLYNTFFSIGWQGMSWMWSVELIPLSIRGPANAFATAANWLSNFIVVIATPAMFFHLTYRTYIFFAVCNFCIVPTIYFFYPETGGRSLEEVDVVFKAAHDKGNAWFSVVKAAKEEPKWFDRSGDRTASYGGSEDSEKDEYETERRNSSEKPDGTFRSTRRSSSRDAREIAAPAPAISRTRSDERTSRDS